MTCEQAIGSLQKELMAFLANSEDEARSIMEKDPAVKENVMTAQLFPYRVALYNPRWEGK